jgi:hypothetical protein
MRIGRNTSDRDLEYYRVCGTPKEKALAKEEITRRIGDEKGGETMARKKVKAEVEEKPVTKVGRKQEAFKVRSKGDLGVPQRIASECGIPPGSKFTCVPTGNVGEVLIKIVDIGGEKE